MVFAGTLRWNSATAAEALVADIVATLGGDTGAAHDVFPFVSMGTREGASSKD